jgi:hypothetical protein
MANLTTFQGSLGNLVCTLRNSCSKGSSQAKAMMEALFPDTRVLGYKPGSLLDRDNWYYNPVPISRSEEIGKTKACRIFWRSVRALEWSTSSTYLFPVRDKCFKVLNRKFRKIRQYYQLSCRDRFDKDEANGKIRDAINEFNNLLPSEFKNWRFGSKTDFPSFLPYRINYPLTVDDLSNLIIYTDMFGGNPRRGKKTKPFSVLILNTVNCFTFRLLDGSGNYIMRGDKYCARKDWQLICAALLWVHIQAGIPEIGHFIKQHMDANANLALGKLKLSVKKNYHNFYRADDSRHARMGKYITRGQASNLDELAPLQ